MKTDSMEFVTEHWGRLGYESACDRQRERLEAVVAGTARSTLFLVEHPAVLTLGANFHAENLRIGTDEYARRGVELVRTDRGGDVTYHGPGQLVAYPVFSLEPWDRDLHRWLRFLESVVIETLREFGVEGSRNPVNTGVWVGNRKIAAIGIKVRRWVSMHGLALNCDVDLAPFGWIVPCGIRGDYGVTSLSEALGRHVSVQEVAPVLERKFREQMPTEALP